jgi:hypothetical protein
VLKLTLELKPFQVMITGEKKEEYRQVSKWIESRLIDSKTKKDRQYDFVHFVNGYGAHRPNFTAQYKGYTLENDGVQASYSNGLKVDTRGQPTYIIFLGDVVEKHP